MRLLYVTKELPFGATEAFILPEVADHMAAGWEVWLAPVSRAPLSHAEGAKLLDQTLDQPLVSPAIAAAAASELARRPAKVLTLFARMLAAGKPGLVIRNLAVFPKALWLAREIRRRRFDHVHIHWAAAPATLGAVAAELGGVPFSITAHRYDIAQNNLLRWKSRRAQFVRAIDAPGAEEIRGRLSPEDRKPVVLHMGVSVAPAPARLRSGSLSPLTLAVAARLVPKKGHGHLLHAIRRAADAGVACRLEVYGDGPLKADLIVLAKELGITDSIHWRGVTSHGDLLAELRGGTIDVGVLPSVTAEDGDKEGIPVFLIECMGAGLPVITTPNGGIVELAGDDCGVMVPERDAQALGDAIVRLARDPDERSRLAAAGRARVLADFEIGACMSRLRDLISPAA